MLAACKRVEKENEAETEELSEENSQLEENETFIHTALSSESFFSGDSESSDEESSLGEEEDN